MAYFDSKVVAVQNQLLQCELLVVRPVDTQIYAANGGNGKLTIGQDVRAVVFALQMDNSVPGVVLHPAANISISTPTEIVITSFALDTNDSILVSYILEQPA